MKHLNDRESREVGEAVGTVLGMTDRILAGQFDFTEDEVFRITEANDLLKQFTFDEQLYLLKLGITGGN